MKKEYLTLNEVLKKLDVSRQSFYRMRRRGEFVKPVIKNPKRWLEKDIDEYYQNIN